MDTLRPVAGNVFDPRFPPPAALPSSDRSASATGWLVGLGSFAAVLLIGIGAMVNVNAANAAAASLPNALMATPVPVLPESAPVVPTQVAPAAIAAIAAPPPAPVGEETRAPTSASARKISKPQPQRRVTSQPVTRAIRAPAAVARPVSAPRAPADSSATKEAQETLLKAMAERSLN